LPQEIFEKMDWDKNGTVSPIEFKSYLANLKKGEELNSEEVYSAFEKIDTDGSRQIQWEEFLVHKAGLRSTRYF
jgi:Ca2+-binding EF-hand superfamily protein